MTAALVLNIILTLTVFSAVVGLIAWAIRTSRPAVTEPVLAEYPRVREHAVRARAAHADRARAAHRGSALRAGA
jgi:hypothetical protein